MCVNASEYFYLSKNNNLKTPAILFPFMILPKHIQRQRTRNYIIANSYLIMHNGSLLKRYGHGSECKVV